MLNWISYKYGFGTYLHLIEDYYSRKSVQEAEVKMNDIIENINHVENYVYVDTIISPSYTSAISQAVQIPGIAGMENNMVIFEYDKQNPANLKKVVENFALVNSGRFDICILACSEKPMNMKNGIHVWINSLDTENSNLMILLSFIILGHPELKKTEIKIFAVCKEEDLQKTRAQLKELVVVGRLPINEKNINVIIQSKGVPARKIIADKSQNAGLTLIGLREELIKHEKEAVFTGYDELGTILFVHSKYQKAID